MVFLKKNICLVIALIILLFTSCAKNTLTPTQSEYQTETIIMPTTSTTVITAGAIATSSAATAIATTATETTPVPTQASTITTTDDFEFHIVGDYHSTREIPFEKLHRMDNNHRVSAEKWYTDLFKKNDVKISNRYSCYSVIITIAGYSGEKSSITQPYNSAEYYVYQNSYDKYVSDGKIYKMETWGYPEEPVYGCYRIEIGEKYLALVREEIFAYRLSQGDDMMLLPFLYKIVEIDGVEWVYPSIYFDLSGLSCAVKITDENEQLFYKKGADDDIIAYLEANNIPNPKIEHKCELNAFIEEVKALRPIE